MGQQQSKDELLYQQVNYGNVEGIKQLCREGASLEWTDREGKTPLIVACMNPELYNVANTLIGLGANVNANRPGRHNGTPLHHAVKRGLERTVKLLLSSGANALLMNDGCQTPLDVARSKEFSNVVRTIENHICLFSGWMREFYGPGFLEVLAPQFVCRKVWVVVLPCGSTKPFKLELAVYSSIQDARPRTTIALWKAYMEEPNFNQPDHAVILVDNTTNTRVKLASLHASDKQQLHWFCNACKGIPQAMNPTFLLSTQTPIVPATAPPAPEDPELAMAINASIQTATERQPPLNHPHPDIPSTSFSNPEDIPPTGAPEASSNDGAPEAHATQPSAPPVTRKALDDGPIYYPPIDSGPIDGVEIPGERDGGASSCVVCLDAPVEGACIPCGHMAGCMSCLKEIKAKKWGCPVCRAEIQQVLRLYAV